MSTYEFSVSLRIRHPDIEPSRITEALGIDPQHSWRAGEPRRDATGAEIGGAHRDSYWVGRLVEEPQLTSGESSIESLLDQTLSRLRRSHVLLDELNAGGGRAELDVSLLAQEDFRIDLSSEALSSIGRLGISVTLEVHVASSVGDSTRQPS